MANDDRAFGDSLVATVSEDELDRFARRHGITTHQARLLFEQLGDDRAALDAAAERLKG